MDKIELTQIDIEDWMFIISESPNKKWIGDFVYSPQSVVISSMLIELTDEEQKQAIKDRNFLIGFAERVRYNFKDFYPRAFPRTEFAFINKNELADMFSDSMGNKEEEFAKYAQLQKIENYQKLIKEFTTIQNLVYNHILKLTEHNIQLTANVIEAECYKFCKANVNWINEKGIKAFNRWLIWMCWHEGILKKDI